jgi:hypothetical protein
MGKRFLRKMFYATAMPAGVFTVVLFGLQPDSETASRFMANATVDVSVLEATIDIKHLPRQDVPPEAYQ